MFVRHEFPLFAPRRFLRRRALGAPYSASERNTARWSSGRDCTPASRSRGWDRSGMSLLKKRRESRGPVPASAMPYWTVRVKVAECVMLPVVAVTVTTELPAGVPGSRLLWPPPPLPPPQPAIVIRSANAIRVRTVPARRPGFTRRREASPSMKIPANDAPKLVNHQTGSSSLALCAALVEMVSVVEPLPVTEAGLKLHVLSRGKPEHDFAGKLMVPA